MRNLKKQESIIHTWGRRRGEKKKQRQKQANKNQEIETAFEGNKMIALAKASKQ